MFVGEGNTDVKEWTSETEVGGEELEEEKVASIYIHYAVRWTVGEVVV